MQKFGEWSKSFSCILACLWKNLYRKWIARMRNKTKDLLDHYELLDESPKWIEIYLFHLIIVGFRLDWVWTFEQTWGYRRIVKNSWMDTYSSIWSATIKWFRLDSTHPILLICSIISLLPWCFIPSEFRVGILSFVDRCQKVICTQSDAYLAHTNWAWFLFAISWNLKWTKWGISWPNRWDISRRRLEALSPT
jgi:hypothetical protein